jgi:hypothetical protein
MPRVNEMLKTSLESALSVLEDSLHLNIPSNTLVDIPDLAKGASKIAIVENACRLISLPVHDMEAELLSKDIPARNTLEEQNIALEEMNTKIDKTMLYIPYMIDRASINEISLINVNHYNYFGLNRRAYKTVLDNLRYKSVYSSIDPTQIYTLFRGDTSFIPQTQVKAVAGVGWIAPPTSLEYRVHLLMCMLIRLEKRDAVAILGRLIREQIQLHEFLG